MPGIILGALAGGADAMLKSHFEEQKSELDTKRQLTIQKASSDLETQRQQTLALFKQNLEMNGANQQREAQVARIDGAAEKIADEQVDSKRGVIAGAIADKSAWTPEQQAAVDQSLALDKSAIVADPKTKVKAAINTGDIDPKTAATLTQKDDAALYKAMWEQSKEDGRNARADARIAAQQESSDKRLAYLFAALEKKGASGQNATKEALSFLEGSRKEIASDAQNLKALYQADLKDLSPSAAAKVKAEYAPKFAEIERKRTQIEEDYNTMRERVGLPSRAAGAGPAPATAPAAAAPKATKPASRPPLSNFLKP